MSKFFDSMLAKGMSDVEGADVVPATVEALTEQKATGLEATFRVRLADSVNEDDLVRVAMEAASARVDDILNDVVSTDILDHRVFQRVLPKRRKGKVLVPTTLYGVRDKKGRLMSGLSLSRLLNLALFKYVQKVMSPRTLTNRTGRFAHSAAITGADFAQKTAKQRKNRVSIYFTYMVAPYEIFESTEPWSDGGRRSPSRIIEKAARDALKSVLSPTSFKNNIFNFTRRDM